MDTMSTTPSASDGASGGAPSTGSTNGAAAAARKESWGELLRKVALASVGAVVLAQEEIEEFVRRLVEKGEIAEKDGRTLVRDLLEKRRRAVESAAAGTPAMTTPPAPEIDR